MEGQKGIWGNAQCYQRAQNYNCNYKYLKVCAAKVTLGQSHKNSVHYLRGHD